MIFKEFHKEIDSLYLSYRGIIKEQFLKELEEKKELAQSEDESKQALAKMTVNDHCFEVLDKGAGNYSYILVDNWYRIQISKSTKNITPIFYIKISSELLNCLGLNRVIKDVRIIILEIMSAFEQEIISRVDLFVDFFTDKDFEKIDKKEWISKADNIHSYWTKDVFTGWTIGQGGVVSARLYNKTVEIKKSKKEYFKEIWEKQGWEEGQTVWRLEFQLRRNILKQMSVNHIYDLEMIINDIWRYCTNHWLRLCIDNGSKNKSRWDTDTLWLKIQDVRFNDGNFTGIERYVDKSRVTDDKILFQMGTGYLAAFAAKNRIKDMDEAMKKFIKDAHLYFDNYLKMLPIPSNSKEYFKTKVELKMKKFNIEPEKEE